MHQGSPAPTSCFNGAAVDERRKAWRRLPTRFPAQSFNGAAVDERRKGGGVVTQP